MKKYIVLFALCSFLLSCITGCADVAESWSEVETGEEKEGFFEKQMTVADMPLEEGYYVIEGVLGEISRHELTLEVEDGQAMHFKLAPETIIYAGENKGLSVGQNIKVVFDGKQTGEEIIDISVIAVTLLEE